MIVPMSDEAYEELSEWLQRRHTGITDIVELEGFLTAIVIAPNALSPMTWLPKVWGGKAPKFRDIDELNRFIGRVVGLYNHVALCFEQAPEQFRPTFYESRVSGKRVFIVDEWCFGFVKGMRHGGSEWNPLKKERPDLLKPILLFGTPVGWKELDAGGADVMHKKWSKKIEPAVRAIHQYWLPRRMMALRKVTEPATH
jgi:uncharacterized protein